MHDKFRNLQHAVMTVLVSVLGKRMRRLDESKVCGMQRCSSFVIIAMARMPGLPLYDTIGLPAGRHLICNMFMLVKH
jgi:hypothetical protein